VKYINVLSKRRKYDIMKKAFVQLSKENGDEI
jgi:hypothetical protein